jgi:hypothetical protein
MPGINTPDHVEKLRTEFKVREGFGLWLLEDLLPVVMVADLSGPAAGGTSYPRDAIGNLDSAAGGAGTNVQHMVQSEPNRGIVFQVNGVSIMKPSSSGRVTLVLGTGTITGGVGDSNKQLADVRLQPGVPDGAIVASAPVTALTLGSRVGQFTVLGNENVFIPLNVFLGAQDFVGITNQTTNEQLVTTWYWTEHMVEDR